MQEFEPKGPDGGRDAADFRAWLAAMEFDAHGGRAKAAAALGVSTETIRRYADGIKPVPHDTRLAMSALAQGLGPWTAKDEGLPAVHVSFSIGRGDREG